MTDETEGMRRALVRTINEEPTKREQLEKEHGQVWNTEELQKDFKVTGFMAPFVLVVQKNTGKEGPMMFQHNPRFYFGFS